MNEALKEFIIRELWVVGLIFLVFLASVYPVAAVYTRQSHNQTFSSTVTDATERGMRYCPNNDLILYNISTDSRNTATRIYVTNATVSTKTFLYNCTLSGSSTCYPNFQLYKNNCYRFVPDNSGSTFVQYYKSSFTLPLADSMGNWTNAIYWNGNWNDGGTFAWGITEFYVDGNICTQDLRNTTASSWSNSTDCLPTNLQNQSRSYVRYDYNNCGYTNTTYYEKQVISCNYGVSQLETKINFIKGELEMIYLSVLYGVLMAAAFFLIFRGNRIAGLVTYALTLPLDILFIIDIWNNYVVSKLGLSLIGQLSWLVGVGCTLWLFLKLAIPFTIKIRG